MNTKASNVGGYYEQIVPEMSEALQSLRTEILALLPGAEEALSYGIPAFKVDGRSVLQIAAFKEHCSLFPGGAAVEKFANELTGYKTSTGTIQFTPEHPLGRDLVERIVEFCLARNAAKTSRPKRKK